MDDETLAVPPADDAFVLRTLFEGAEQEQYAANRRAARRAEDLADALDYARTHPWVYVDEFADSPEGVELAERCAVMEAASRLCLSENAVRAQAAAARAGRRDFPLLWRTIREGFATVAHLDAALAGMAPFDAEQAERYDRALAELALTVTLGRFRREARELARTIAPQPESALHAAALTQRRVVVEDALDGMSWFMVLTSTTKARAAKRRLTSTAKHLSKSEREERTRDQLRADLATALLLGERTPQMVTTKVFVTVPLDRLSPAARATVRPHIPGRAGLDLNRECLIPGEGPIDDATARQLLLDEGSFTRVITDPVTGVVLDMDRRSRRATTAQRAWLTLVHGTCRRDGCDRLAIDADIDHWCAFHGPKRGPTNIANLDPYCDPDHAVKDTTKIRHRRRSDQSVELTFPTGHRTRRALDATGVLAYLAGDDPPF
jgi:hypothetical protein